MLFQKYKGDKMKNYIDYATPQSGKSGEGVKEEAAKSKIIYYLASVTLLHQ